MLWPRSKNTDNVIGSIAHVLTNSTDLGVSIHSSFCVQSESCVDGQGRK